MKKLLSFLSAYSPWLVFLPFFLLWAAMAWTMMDNSALVMDEVRYWGFAENLLNGHFHYLEGDNFLWSGPGYPISLVPFVALDAHLGLVKVMNAVYLYLAVVLLWKAMAFYFSREKAYLIALLWALYYPLYSMALPNIMTEALVTLTVTAVMYTTVRAIHGGKDRWRDLILPGFCVGFMVMTKIIFGYVVLLVAAVLALAWLRRRGAGKLRTMARIMALGVLFLLPYLSYTFALTGKPLYWGNTAGLSLYWMSSPYAEELGDWHGPGLGEHPKLMEHHGEFFASIAGLGPVEKDDALKAKAIENIKAHPKKFVYNCVANVGRTLFSHPLSYLEPSNGLYYYVVPNIFLVVFTLLFLWPTVRWHRRYPTEMLVLLFMALLYFAETIPVSSYARFFFLIIPILLWWIGFTLDRFVRVDFGREKLKEGA